MSGGGELGGGAGTPSVHWASRTWIPWWIFALALALRLAHVGQAAGADPLFSGVRLIADSQYYEFYARAIASGEWRPVTPYFLAPLYAYVMGALYAITGPSLMAVKILQCLLGAVSCVLVHAIGRRVFDARVGAVAGAALALYGLHVFYSGVILPTVLVVFLNLLFLWCAIDSGDRPSPGRLAGAGVVLGLAVAAKPNAILMLPAAAIALLLVDRSRDWRRWGIRCAILFAATGITISPFIAHNYAVSGELVFMTTTSGRNLLKGNGPEATGTHVFLSPETRGTPLARYLDDDVDPVAAVEESRRMSAETRRYMAEHPGATASLWWTKLVLWFSATELPIRDHFEFAKRYSGWLSAAFVSFGWAVPLALAGLAFAWRSHPRSLFLYGALAAQLASFLPLFVLARYRLVAVACLLPFAGWAAWRAIDAVRARDVREIARLGAAWLVALAVVHAPLHSFSRERGYADQWLALGDGQLATRRAAAAVRAYRNALASEWLQPDDGLRELETRIRLVRALRLAGEPDAAEIELVAASELAERIGSRGSDRLIRSLERLRTPGGGTP